MEANKPVFNRSSFCSLITCYSCLRQDLSYVYTFTMIYWRDGFASNGVCLVGGQVLFKTLKLLKCLLKNDYKLFWKSSWGWCTFVPVSYTGVRKYRYFPLSQNDIQLCRPSRYLPLTGVHSLYANIRNRVHGHGDISSEFIGIDVPWGCPIASFFQLPYRSRCNADIWSSGKLSNTKQAEVKDLGEIVELIYFDSYFFFRGGIPNESSSHVQAAWLTFINLHPLCSDVISGCPPKFEHTKH